MQQRPHNQITAPGKPGAAIIAKLEKLRDSHRLGLHMWEEHMPFSFPETSHKTLSEWQAHPSSVAPQLSISLLPSKDDGITLQPYNQTSGEFTNVGYLFDLRDGQPTPPRYIAGHTQTLESGENAYNKRFQPDYGGVDLDQLAANYKSNHTLLHNSTDIARYNEILAEIGHPHVAAIVVSSFEDATYPVDPYDAMITLSGCISALEHAKRGADLPLVVYHVNGKHKGEITYLGQGKEQLQKLAMESLKAVMDSPSALVLMRVSYGTMQLTEILHDDFGIDFEKPSNLQREAFAKFGVDVKSRGRE